MGAPPLLAVAGASKRYAGVTALDGVHLALHGGEVHALMGENGAGKSTLIKILAGVTRADTLTVTTRGAPARLASPTDAHALGLRFVHQELQVVASLTVAESLHLGRPLPRRTGLGLLGAIDHRALTERAAAALAIVGANHVDPRRTMGRLGTGDRVLVQIARAFIDGDAGGTRIYVLDEPTAALSHAESEQLFAAVARLRALGHAVLHVTHRLSEVLTHADRITVLRDGRVVAERSAAGTNAAALIADMTGQAPTTPTPPEEPRGEMALEANALGITLRVARGEIVGLAGLAGSGRTALLRSLIGDRPGATVRVADAAGPMRPLSGGPGKAWRRGIAFLPEERRSEGLIMAMSIRENVTLPHVRGPLRPAPARERSMVTSIAERVRLRARGSEQRVHALSGGNQQKVLLARALLGNPAVLLLDEPTRGVDVAAKADIHALVREAAARGAAVVFASSESAELLALAHRVIVLRRGGAPHALATAGASEADLLVAMAGRS